MDKTKGDEKGSINKINKMSMRVMVWGSKEQKNYEGNI